MASNFNITDASVQNLFKRQYSGKSLNTYNGKVPLLGLVKKSFDLVGLQREMEAPTGFQGGAGSGNPPSPNRGIYVKPIVSAKEVYCTTEIDRKTIALAKSEGAFVDAMQETVRKTVEKFNWNMSRQLLNTLVNGSLGTIDSVSVVTAGSVWDVVITAATFKLANWEIRDFVNCGTGNTGKFEITAVTSSTRTIRLSKIDGSDTPTAADVVYLQGSEGNDVQSVAGAIAATTGTLWSVTVGYRWQSYQQSAASAGISSALLNKLMLGVEEQCGVTPNLILTSYIQLRKLMDSMEDQKFYGITSTSLAPRADNLKGVVSFPAVQFMSTQGPVPIIVDRFCDSDKVYALNTDHVELLHAPKGGWFDDDGTVFMRKNQGKAYEATYGYYVDSYAPPAVAGYVHTLSTTG